MSNQPKILLIYTGGTIGMIADAASGELKPFNFKSLTDHIPELKKFKYELSSIEFDEPIDSSNMSPEVWIKLTRLIADHEEKYDGFVILHGSDTMAFTASALSFMLLGLNKPVILTGSQLPIGVIRTDGKENLITAIEVAAARKEDGSALVKEVCVYFEYELLRGNRSTKYNSEHFDAFRSPNFTRLAEAGVNIEYNKHLLINSSGSVFTPCYQLNNDVAILKLFPGFSKKITQSILNTPGVKLVVMETYGSGNAPTADWFVDELKSAIDRGIIILNITQCMQGKVVQGKYETSSALEKIGVIGGGAMTFECAVTKSMYLLAKYSNTQEVIEKLQTSICGEL